MDANIRYMLMILTFSAKEPFDINRMKNEVDCILRKYGHKPKYKKEGVVKGMRGCVMSEYAIKGQWQIIFSEEGTGKDVADIMVSEEDLILVP